LIFAFSNTFLYAGLGRLIAGIGGVTVFIISLQIVSQWFRGAEIGTAMGIYNTAMPIGTLICFNTFGKLGESLGWRMPMFITAAICALGLLAFLILYKPAPNLPQKTPHDSRGITGLFSTLAKMGSAIWLLSLCFMWFNAATLSFSTFAPDFFVSMGYSIAFAGFLASLRMWGSLGLSPLVGRLVDRFNNNDIFIGVGGVILGVTIYMITRSSNFILLMIVMTVVGPLIPTPIFSLPAKILEAKNLGLGFGILTMFSGIGALFGPYMAGAIRDQTGSYEMTFIFLSILAILITVTAFILRIKRAAILDNP
jgi:predicted MFS family arabinose efflux permease